ncbi:MAG TPA: DUF4232 domain-containing protein [Acidimicrobiales bacterium]|nr:DUF4232 domain-containing protein [Acidimicrobiales bacterium]HLN41163.1 DUF4232 domain-containing protein [Acidimicrobiales bacterium]
MVVAAVLGAFGMAACSSNGNGSTQTTGGTTSTGSSSSTSISSTTTSSTAAGAACAARDLSISVVGSQGAAGTFELTFALHNTSTSPCPSDGYPSVQLLDASGTELPTHVVSGGNYQFTNFAPSPVQLAPGATAYFNLAYSDVPSGGETTCPTAAQIEVTPPHAVDHGVVAVQLAACGAGTLTVSPVFGSGSPGSQTTAPARS